MSEGLKIPKIFGADVSDANILPATLHTWGATPAIVLDGTYDGMF